MSIKFVDQISSLSVFTPVDLDTGAILPTETWSDKLWTTEFAENLRLDGLVLSWPKCKIYHQRHAYVVLAGNYAFVSDPSFSTLVLVWLDPTSVDNLTIDLVLLNGFNEPPGAPVANGDIVRLAWGTLGAGATTLDLNVLRHVEEF